MKKNYCTPMAKFISMYTENYCAIDITQNLVSGPGSFDLITDYDALGEEE